MAKPPEDGPCEVTITAPDHDWLRAFVCRLIEDRYAAAAHVDIMNTTYRWDGEILSADEARAIIHCPRSQIAAIGRRLGAEHPFKVPCFVWKYLDGGDPTYLDWVRNSGGPATFEAESGRR